MSRSKSSDESRVPMRRCIGCRTSRPKHELIRIALEDGNLRVDPEARARGRGVYLCKSEECIKKAAKNKAVNRGFRQGFPEEILETIYSEVETLLQEGKS